LKYTQNFNLKKPEGTDVVNIDDLNYNADVIDTELAARIKNGGGVPSIQGGLDAEKPAPGTAGRLYIATDTQLIYRDTGTAWQKVGVVNWNDIANKPSVFSPATHTHNINEITNLSNTVVLKGTSNQDVNLVQALIQSVDTRNTSLTYDGNNRLTTITEKDGTTTVKTTTLSYDANGRLSTVTEVVGGKTIITTLSYDSYSNIVGVSKEVI